MKQVQIPFDVFLSLLRIHVAEKGTAEDEEKVRCFLEEKVEKLADRKRYSQRVSGSSSSKV